MENADVHFILFVNSKSGDGRGAALLDLGGNQITIRYESNHTAKLHIFDLFHAPSRTGGLALALSFSRQEGLHCRVVICGGDGTIPWVLSELYEAGVELSQVVIGILPIGTGNDFSRSLGWGASGPRVSRNQLGGLGDLVK
jgi:diacylglycerol kinase (ATP)